ncbi:MAG: hypothetical protein R3E31_11405 [Chloroflexota bacterium]
MQLTLVAPDSQLYLVLRDPLPKAGTEAIDPGLNTSASGTNVTFPKYGSTLPVWLLGLVVLQSC